MTKPKSTLQPSHALRRVFAIRWRNDLLAIFVSTFAAAASAAEPFTIQIGAFKTPNETYSLPARTVGEIYATQRGKGIVALSVGRFADVDEATAALAQISQHYPSAYVRHAHPQAQLHSDNKAPATANKTPLPTTTPADVADQQQPLETELLSTLTDDERKHVVYLDGKLHYKQGNTFVPLAQYRAQHARP
ncbi:MAG: SPOR domain-containing protein [Pseudomonadales bacterium]